MPVILRPKTYNMADFAKQKYMVSISEILIQNYEKIYNLEN